MREEPTKTARAASWFAGLIILSLVFLTYASIPPQVRSANSPGRVPTISIQDLATNSYLTPEIAPQPTHPASSEIEEPSVSQSSTQSIPATASATKISTLDEQLSIYGSSVRGRPLEVVRLIKIGTRPTGTLILVAGIHGDESNTVTFLNDLHNLIRLGRFQMPIGIALYLINDANPDGAIEGERTNANGVDLNRNWETFDWQQNTFTVDGLRAGAGGVSPFSEPETVGLRDFLLLLKQQSSSPPNLIFLHAAFPDTGLITPGHHLVENQILADATARQLGQKLSGLTGYRYANQWVGSYPVTGDATTWAVAQQMPAITLELPQSDTLNGEDTLALFTAIENLMSDLAGVLSTD